jgi:hypothetical protein
MLKVVKSPGYNYLFNVKNGFFARWGKTIEDDPDFSPLGPEILDFEISTICNGGCSFCSPSGILVNTPDGKKPIEDVKEKDMIIGFDFKTKKQQIQEVIEIYVRDYDGDLIEIYMKNGNVLKVTPDHKIYTNRGWIPANKLTENDELADIECSAHEL